METLESIRERLEVFYMESYRKISIQSNSRPSQRDVLITLFPINGEYRIISFRNLREISYENIFNLLQKEILD